MPVRAAEDGEVDSLARIWYDGWQDAHAEILPAELARVRTLQSFRERLLAVLPAVRAAVPPGAPVGFCIVADDELYQLYVSAEARGSGVAAELVADAEARLASAGVGVAWLACAIGNDRAARFYEKCGWHRTGTVTSRLPMPHGELALDVWRYEKVLTSGSARSATVAPAAYQPSPQGERMNPDVDVLTQFFAAINGNDMQAMIRHFDPQIVRIEPDGFPTAGTYRGIAEVQEHVRRGRATWAEGSCEPEKFLMKGEKVVVYLHARVRLHDATDWTGGRFADGFVFRDGKITEYRSFGERMEALKWAGIPDQEPM